VTARIQVSSCKIGFKSLAHCPASGKWVSDHLFIEAGFKLKVENASVFKLGFQLEVGNYLPFKFRSYCTSTVTGMISEALQLSFGYLISVFKNLKVDCCHGTAAIRRARNMTVTQSVTVQATDQLASETES
jgi:hypothetical protein